MILENERERERLKNSEKKPKTAALGNEENEIFQISKTKREKLKDREKKKRR